jgi:hypothetical protein
MSEQEKPIRVLIADYHLIIREGMRLILEAEIGFELIGEACNGEEAIRLANELHPDGPTDRRPGMRRSGAGEERGEADAAGYRKDTDRAFV